MSEEQTTVQERASEQSFVVQSHDDAKSAALKSRTPSVPQKDSDGYEELVVDSGKNLKVRRPKNDSESSATAEALINRYRTGKRDHIVYADEQEDKYNTDDRLQKGALAETANRKIEDTEALMYGEEAEDSREDESLEDTEQADSDEYDEYDDNTEEGTPEGFSNKQENEEDIQLDRAAEKEATRLRKILDSVLDAKKVEWEAEKQSLSDTVEALRRENERLKALEDDKKLSKPLFDEAPEQLIKSIFSSDAPEYLRNMAEDYPDIAKAMVEVTSKMFDRFVKSAAERQEALYRSHERQQQALQAQAEQTVKQLGNIGINAAVFGSPEYRSFETSSEGNTKHAEYAERFGFGTLEYARHMYDAFSRDIKKTVRAKAKDADKRTAIAAQQKKNDSSRVSSNPVGTAKADVSRMSSSERAAYELEQYRKQRSMKR